MLNSANLEEGPFQFWIIMIMLSATLNSSPKWKWGKVLTRTKRNEFVRAFQFFAEKKIKRPKRVLRNHSGLKIMEISLICSYIHTCSRGLGRLYLWKFQTLMQCRVAVIDRKKCSLWGPGSSARHPQQWKMCEMRGGRSHMCTDYSILLLFLFRRETEGRCILRIPLTFPMEANFRQLF